MKGKIFRTQVFGWVSVSWGSPSGDATPVVLFGFRLFLQERLYAAIRQFIAA